MKESNLSHSSHGLSLQEAVQKMKAKVTNRQDLDKEVCFKIIDQLVEFDLGRFLVLHGGLNGEWTEYINRYPERKPRLKNEIENFILNKAPTALGMQSRYQTFRNELQDALFEGCHFASVPCGWMSAFLDLDFRHLSHFKLTGIDLDDDSLNQASKIAEAKKLPCTFLKRDAWDLGVTAQFDLLTSNGLSFYEESDDRVTMLYASFAKALKPGGTLLTSFLTPPQLWNPEKVNPEDAAMQKILFVDLIESRWQTFRTEEVVREQLCKAGFTIDQLIYDEAKVFPTVIARKN